MNYGTKTFVRAAQTGVALGLEHRYEWYRNALSMLQYTNYAEIPANEAKIKNAFLSFERGLATCSQEEIYFRSLTIEDYEDLVDNWYKKQRE